MSWAAIVTAAGKSRRLGGQKKEWLPLNGGTVIAASVAPFIQHPGCQIVLVTHPQGEVARMSTALGHAPVQHCSGGETRAQSVWLALQQLEKTHPQLEYVLIHDGARPWVSSQLISRVLAGLARWPAVIPALACQQALKEMAPGEERLIAAHLPRQDYVLAQTPQAFSFPTLLRCYRTAFAQGLGSDAADDAELWQHAGGQVHTVDGERSNIKITHREDLALLGIHTQAGHPRCGQGYDTHRLAAGRRFLLGGIDITRDRGPIAHSDGDVLIHACIDALLGAAALGDVGQLFPDTDPRYAGCDSALLLKEALVLVQHAGWQLGNIDVTVVLEQPKLGPYREAIRQNLADLLSLPLSSVSLKAKTAEGLGAVGRGEAVACWVNALLFPQRRV